MEPAGGVDEHHIGPSGLGGRGGVKDHGGGVGPLVLLDDLHTGALGPDGQLLGGGGTEGVGGTQQNLFPLIFELMADLADGGGLAHAVDSDKQYHGGLGGQIQGGLTHGHGIGDHPAHALPGLFHGLDVLLPHPAPQLLHQFQGGIHTGIRQDEGLLQLIIEVVGELGTKVGKNIDLLQFIKKSHIKVSFSSFRSRGF